MWYANILCRIMEGKAYLAYEVKGARVCNGKCFLCDSFRGIDISQIGMMSLSACCLRSGPLLSENLPCNI